MGLVKAKIILLFVFTMFLPQLLNGSVYKVGDNTGWSIVGYVNYAKWASPKTFQVGDILIFQYTSPYHNVLQVSRSDFHSCNANAPIATYTTGNDSIVLRSPGHYFYICGFVGHCQAGQKVDIRVPKSSQPVLIPILSPIPGPPELAAPEASPIGPLRLGPSPNNGVSLLSCRRLFWWLVILIWALI